jgi:hypothetical protein
MAVGAPVSLNRRVQLVAGSSEPATSTLSDRGINHGTTIVTKGLSCVVHNGTCE